jgi:hypothetical protein
LLLNYLFNIGVPLAARGTFAQPFGRLISAMLTEVCSFDFAHAEAKVEKEKGHD